jgi:hypothetical protein
MASQEPPDELQTKATMPVRPAASNLKPWLIILALIVVEYGFFAQLVRREIAWFIPTSYDQCQYLDISYNIHGKIVSDGPLKGLMQSLWIPLPNGALFHILAALLCLVLGPSRLTVLTVHFLLFAGLQCSLAATLHWYSRRWSAAFFGLGLLLAAITPFFGAGGLLDARLDFGAFCLYGMFICAAVRSRLFASHRWAVVVGMTAAVLALYRHITVVYLAGIFTIAVGFFTLRWLLLKSRSPARRVATRQITGLLVAGSILAALLVPVLLLKFDALWKYYVVNVELGGDRDVRAAEFGVNTLQDHFLFYLKSLVTEHAGRNFLGIAGLALVAALALWLAARRHPSEGGGPRIGPGSLAFFLGLCLVVPYAILTRMVSKSPVVGNILVIPLMWLVLLPLLGVARRGLAPGKAKAALGILGFVGCTWGVFSHFQMECTMRGGWFAYGDDAKVVLTFHDDIVQCSRDAGLKNPHIAYDCIAEFLHAGVTDVRAFEQHGQNLQLSQLMPNNGVLAMDETAIRQALDQSHFVVLAGESYFTESLYPFNQQMKAWQSELRAYCDRELIHIKRYAFQDTSFDLYMRPWVNFHGNAGPWVTSKGLTLTGPGAVLTKASAIELRGKINLKLLGSVPVAKAAMKSMSDWQPLPAALQVDDGEYRLRLTLPVAHDLQDEVEIHLDFDRFFVPRDLGFGRDGRQLVVHTPREIKVMR